MTRPRHYFDLLVLVALAHGCGDNGPPVLCIAGEDVTITQGLYGRVTDKCYDGRAIADEPIEVLDRPLGSVVFSGVSDASGAFQIELPVGDYALCVGGSCTSFDVVLFDLVHADFRMGCTVAWRLEEPTYCAAK